MKFLLTIDRPLARGMAHQPSAKADRFLSKVLLHQLFKSQEEFLEKGCMQFFYSLHMIYSRESKKSCPNDRLGIQKHSEGERSWSEVKIMISPFPCVIEISFSVTTTPTESISTFMT